MRLTTTYDYGVSCHFKQCQGFCRISKPPIGDQVNYGAQTLDEST